MLFVYGFMEENSWIKVERPQGNIEITELANPTSSDRIALVQELTNDSFRARLLQIAAAEGDNDLMKEADTGQLIGNYLRSLIRFFAMGTSFGFEDNMEDISSGLSLTSLGENAF